MSFSLFIFAVFTPINKSHDSGKATEEGTGGDEDDERLLYNFLEELLFLMDSENLFLSTIKVKIKGNELAGEGSFGDAGDYDIGLDVKAITYNEMKVWKEKGKFICQVVLDV